MVKVERLTTCSPFGDIVKQPQVVLQPNKGRTLRNEEKEGLGIRRGAQGGPRMTAVWQTWGTNSSYRRRKMDSSGRVVGRKKEVGWGTQEDITVSDLGEG